MDRRGFLTVLGAVGLAACTRQDHSSDSAPTSAPSVAETVTAPAEGATASSIGPTEPPATLPPVALGVARYVPAGPSTSDGVALTFHVAGEPQLATRLLDLLRERQVPITAFVVGQWLAANPTFSARLQGEGNEIGNHTYAHRAMGGLSPSEVASEIARAADVIREQTGGIGRWFRPSGIAVPTPTILTEAGKVGYAVSIGYSVDSLDFKDPGPAAVRANIAVGVTGGSIVSLHFGHAGTIDALPGVLDDLAARGLRPVTVTELLA